MHSLCGCLKGECQEHKPQIDVPNRIEDMSEDLGALIFLMFLLFIADAKIRRISVAKLSISSYQQKSFSERFCCDSETEAQLRC